jgi:outer membrane protein assembly factor BamB
MTKPLRLLLLTSILVVENTPSPGMTIESVWMTGRAGIEAVPLFEDFDGDGVKEILAVNRVGQVYLWDADMTPATPEPGGMVARLPEGIWAASPAILSGTGERILVFCSGAGRLIALDSKFQVLWEYQLPGKTSFEGATPAILQDPSDQLICMGDDSGNITCLDSSGQVVWTRKQEGKPCGAGPSVAFLSGGRCALVPCGNTLTAIRPDGEVLWQRDLGGKITTTPSFCDWPEKKMVFCGAGEGSLFGLSLGGEILWEFPIGDALSDSIALLPRQGQLPLVLCSGVWGNLFAFDLDGKPVWKHLYRAKGRGKPLIADLNFDRKAEIYRPTYSQRLFVFDESGSLVDEVRFGAIVHASPIVIPGSDGSRRVLVCCTSITAYRLKPGPPIPFYRDTGKAMEVLLSAYPPDLVSTSGGVRLSNPNGGLVNLELRSESPSVGEVKQGIFTVRSGYEVPFRGFSTGPDGGIEIFARDTEGKVLQQIHANSKTGVTPQSQPPAEGGLRVWSTPAYGEFSPLRAQPYPEESDPDGSHRVEIHDLYQGEAGQGAFLIASDAREPLRARVTVTAPTDTEKNSFAGSIRLREVVMTGTVNGESVPDALPALQEGNLILLPPGQSAKVWVCVDAKGAAPGKYTGAITVSPLDKGREAVKLVLDIEVLDLSLPETFPMSLCTWDGVPNRWYQTRLDEVLDDMSRHGVNVFPHSHGVPKARVDAQGRMEVDWSGLDAEIDRLGDRGILMLPFNRPQIIWEKEVTEEVRHPYEIQYLRDLRDHLKAKGWGYDRFMLYPVDEPGHDAGNLVDIQVASGQLFREADPNIRIYTDPVWGLPWEDFQRCLPYVDIWAPNMRLVGGLLCQDPRMEYLLNSGHPVWSYECISQVKSISPLRYTRSYAWRAKYFGLKGMGVWTHSEAPNDHWFTGKGINDEYALVYPGEVAVPSARWEALRDGLEDISALALLEQEIEKVRSMEPGNPVLLEAEKEVHLATNDMMDLSDLAFVESRDYLKQGDRVIWHTRNDEELIRMHRSLIARLTQKLIEK